MADSTTVVALIKAAQHEERLCGAVLGATRPRQSQQQHRRRLELNTDVELQSPHRCPVSWLDVDQSEGRYLLTAAADGAIALFDLDSKGVITDADGGGQLRRRIKRLSLAPRTPPAAHRTAEAALRGHCYAASAVQWYPVDNGLFISAGMDGVVKAWDTNTFKVVLDFNLPAMVFAAALPPSSAGHSGEVWAVAWSPADEYLLASGATDCRVRLWDIRRSGASACLMILDQNQTAGEYTRLLLWETPSGANTLTHYLGTKNRRVKPFRMAPAEDLVFFPVEGTGDVLGFPVNTHDGRAECALRGHFETVQACAYRATTQELITSGADGLVLLWSCPATRGVAGGAAQDEADDWSSDDEGGSNGAADTGGGAFVPPILMQEPPRRRGRAS
ncbi:WD40-repeat-containing domain protein [Tribonema minus]|uniref:WD40-repeat-containing domain protein n=1 Tax=Tribonema minus TaxID=303371 RepID=A0A835YTD9_9STRA|nr:WD40-repeat-containing domain protein [Tribonema minus]